MASIIKADNIQKVSDGTNIIKKCGSTTTIGSGACSPIVICGSTVTLGRCGGTVTLASGATQTGFGQTYSAVEYCTTAKTSPFTAAAGTGYFINTTCGAVTVTLPASPTAGDVVAFKDYASQWNTNNVTLCNNGNKINGICGIASLSTQNQSVSLIYVDATKGWQDIQDSTAGVSGASYITATGGTISCCGDYKIHTFTSDGTFCVSAGCGPIAVVDYLVVAGGGGASAHFGGGGGAGGARMSSGTASGCYTASPLGACVAAIPVSVQGYPITVGGGGAGAVSPPCGPAGANGSNSIFSTITSTGGGGGGDDNCAPGQPGGSGGAGGNSGPTAGNGNTPPVSPPQGNPGSVGRGNVGTGYLGGGGGGAGAAGQTVNPGTTCGAAGGAGVQNAINGTNYYWAGGGGGTGGIPGQPAGGGDGGAGGGGGASNQGNGPAGVGGPGLNPGTNGTQAGGSGGSGIVIIRYKFQ
jgi:hypothetical protein